MESLKETLEREYLEETGYSITVQNQIITKDFFIDGVDTEFNTHHIAVIYKVNVINKNQKINEYIKNCDGSSEKNDSSEIIWLNIQDINEKNSSPLVLYLKKIYNKNFENIEFDVNATFFNNWVVKK